MHSLGLRDLLLLRHDGWLTSDSTRQWLSVADSLMPLREGSPACGGPAFAIRIVAGGRAWPGVALSFWQKTIAS